MQGWSSEREKHVAVVYVFSFRRKCCFRDGPFRMTFTVRQTCKDSRDTYMSVMINGKISSSFI